MELKVLLYQYLIIRTSFPKVKQNGIVIVIASVPKEETTEPREDKAAKRP